MAKVIKPFVILLGMITLSFIFFLIVNKNIPESIVDVYTFWCLVIIGIAWLFFASLGFISYGFSAYKKIIQKFGITKASANYLEISIIFVFLFIVTYVLTHYWTSNSLKPDEEMLVHFKANRATFEALASEYRSLSDDPRKNEKYEWENANKIRSIKQKLAIKKINESSPLWLQDPYSVNSIKQLDELVNKIAINRHQINTLEISLKDRGESWSILHLKFRILKSYVHFPVEPKTEQGQLLLPWHFASRQVSKGSEVKTHLDVLVKPTARLLGSLDIYPSNWKRGECVFRKIDGEEVWFLKLCNL